MTYGIIGWVCVVVFFCALRFILNPGICGRLANLVTPKSFATSHASPRLAQGNAVAKALDALELG
jgi:hypothetical protein